MKNENLRHILSRLSIAVILVGFGMWEVVQPIYWTSFVPQQLSAVASATDLVLVHGVMLLAVGIAVLLGFYLRISSVLAVLIMAEVIGVLLLESGFTDLIIRDTVVLLIALSLVFDDTRYLAITK